MDPQRQEAGGGAPPPDESGGWQTAGENVDPFKAPDAPDNLASIPGWLWALAALAVLLCMVSAVTITAGMFLVNNMSARTALACVGATTGLIMSGLVLYITPMFMGALDSIRKSRRRGQE